MPRRSRSPELTFYFTNVDTVFQVKVYRRRRSSADYRR
jgi:hypothetical protein